MKTKAAILLVFFSLLVIAIFGGLFSMIAEANRQDQQRERDWLQFSQDHRCRIVRDRSFADPSTLWQCDGGFQVRR